jgi:hypothetical protein
MLRIVDTPLLWATFFSSVCAFCVPLWHEGELVSAAGLAA